MGSDASDRLLDELLAQTGWIRRLAQSLVGDASDDDDVVQETCLAAPKTPPDPGRGPRGRGWSA